MIRSFTICAIFASYAAAVCQNDPATDSTCADFSEVQDAIATYAKDVSFRFETVTTADGYDITMVRFTGDMNGAPIFAGDTKGPVLFWHSAT